MVRQPLEEQTPPLAYGAPHVTDQQAYPVTAAPAPVYVQQQPPVASAPVSPGSHVSSRPEKIEGHNFDPRLRAQYSNEPGVIHASRPLEPEKNEISDELRQKHEASVEKYPYLNLTEGEFVVMQLQRHPIGLLAPVGIASFLIIILLSFLFSYPVLQVQSAMLLPSMGMVALVTLLLCALIGVFAYIAIWVYLRNQFFLTNESIIQELQYSLVSRREQTASLGSIEDVSYLQKGLLQTMLNYGSIRLSTEGDETTYRFYYVSNPKIQTQRLTNAVEAFKNGRPVSD